MQCLTLAPSALVPCLQQPNLFDSTRWKAVLLVFIMKTLLFFCCYRCTRNRIKVRQCIAEHRHSRNVYTLRVVIKIHEAKFLREKMFKGSVRVACHVVMPFIIAIPIVPTLVWRMGVWTPVKDCTTAADPKLHKWATNCQANTCASAFGNVCLWI